MSIKSVHLTNYYHKDSGGISTAYNKLLEGANRHRRYVRLIVPGEESRTEEIGEFGRIYYVKAGYSPVFDKRYRILLPWKTYLLDQSPIKKILREEKADLIEVGEKYTLSLMAGLIRKGIMNVSAERPVLVHYSCERMDDNVGAFLSAGRASRRFTRAVMRNYIFPMFDFHLTNSDYTADELRDAASHENLPGSGSFRRFCWRLLRTPKSPPQSRIYVNQCGVDINNFSAKRKAAEKRSRLCGDHGIPETAVLLLYAGRLSPEKNVGLLPSIMKRLTDGREGDFRLLVAGGGPEQQKLAAAFRSVVPGKVTMLGHINDADALADLFANCDAFVHPNPREPFGITPLEAMASGLPVAAPNSGGVLSYANGTNAWLCDPNAESFADAIIEMFDDDADRCKRVENALATAMKYDWETATSNLFAIYDRMFEEYTLNKAAFNYKDSPKDLDLSQESVSHA